MPFTFNAARITLFSPFSSHVFHDSQVGNLIDSALVLEDKDGTSAFNANDNTPDFSACTSLKHRFKRFDLAMINYNAAGPYPSCFKNLSENDKINAHNSILYRNISHLVECCNILQPKVVLPFAGSYVIGGSQYQKNKFLGTTTLDHCAEQIRTLFSQSHNVARG